jgi:hypothetical protein
MSPRAIVEKSLEMGLEIIALCDHNSAENVGAAMRAGTQKGLTVLPGMEINSREEVHTLAIFQSENQASSMQEIVYRHLRGTNRPELFGDQVVANEFDEVEGFNDRRLIGATELRLQQIVQEVHRLGGLCIASHVDRPAFSILSQLGFVPGDLELDALEVSPHHRPEAFKGEVTGLERFAVLSFSDAHFLEDIGKTYSLFLLDSPSLEEIGMALREEAGRRVLT